MMKQNLSQRTSLVEALTHIIGWGIVFGFPFFMMSRSGFNITWSSYLRHGCIVPLSFLIIFYLNYCLLIPRYLFSNHVKTYLVLNLVCILIIALGSHFWQEFSIAYNDIPRPNRRPDSPPKWMFFLRDVFSMVLTVGLSAAIRMSRRWAANEAARREAEQQRTEAELKNLRSQLNPHFLLNTLNNIYALIMFDTPRAQEAVQELSRLLRYVLYDNQQRLVALPKEAEFIRNYIELMRIRMPANVTMDIDIGIDPSSKTMIAPLIFISLIENSFKHGISPTQPSHITIRLSEKDGLVTCHTGNSNHPKQSNDKSGSGIGLGQVRRRLDLIYPMRYRWTCTADEKLYVSTLTIDTRHDTTQLHHRR